MFNKKRIVVAVVFILFMFCFITFAGGTPQNQAIATRNVTFIDSYNNAEISAQRVIVGEDADVPEDPDHTGLVFVGWYLENDRDTRITDFTNIVDNVTVVALYGADLNGNGIVDDDDETYTVTFVDSTNNAVITTREVLVGMAAVPPTVPLHAGLTFTGWDASYTNVRRNTTVNAVYRAASTLAEVTTHTVSFVDGIDGRVIATIEVEEGLTAAAPEAPVHDGYVFVRWDGDLDDITEDTEIRGIYAVDSNGNGEADDTETKYTVSYNTLFGSEEVKNEAPRHEKSFITTERYTVLENTFELDGYVFVGWTEDEAIASTAVTSAPMNLVQPGTSRTIGDENVVYYAVWAEDENGDGTPDYEPGQKFQVSITYGYDESTTVEKTVLKGTKLADVLPSQDEVDPSDEDDYAFDKWVIVNGTTRTTITDEMKDKEISSDLTIEAEYGEDKNHNGLPDTDPTEKRVSISFVVNDDRYKGTFAPVVIEDVLTGTTIGEAITSLPTVPEDLTDSITFDKWVYEDSVVDLDDEGFTSITVGEEDIVIEAVFADDLNNNGKKDNDSTEKRVDISFVVNDDRYEGTYEPVVIRSVLSGITFGEAIEELPTIEEVAEDVVVFDHWTYKNVVVDLEDATFTDLKVGEEDVEIAAVFADDLNHNNKKDDDLSETRVTVSFTVKDSRYKGTFQTVTKANVLSGIALSEVVAELPTVPEDLTDGITFDKWVYETTDTEATLTDKVGETDTVVVAKFVEDRNDDGEKDSTQDAFKVVYYDGKEVFATDDNEGKGYLANEKYTLPEANKDEVTLLGWSTEKPANVITSKEAEATVKYVEAGKEMTFPATEEDVVYYAVWAEDENGDGTPDYEDGQKFEVTVIYGYETETTVTETFLKGTKFSDVLPSEDVVDPSDENDYAFDKWVIVNGTTQTEITEAMKNTEISSDVTIKAIYGEDKNHNGLPDTDTNETRVTVSFAVKDSRYKGTFQTVTKANVLSGIALSEVFTELPTVPEDLTDGITFDKWVYETDDTEVALTDKVGETNTVVVATFVEDRNDDGKKDSTQDTFKVVYYDGDEVFETDDNEGKGYLVNEKYTLPETTKEDVTLLGWSTEKPAGVITSKEDEAAVTYFAAGKEMTFPATEEDVVYYAVWAEDKNENGLPDYDNDTRYSIAYENLVETVTMDEIEPATILSGLTYTIPTPVLNPTEQKVLFLGWVTDSTKANTVIRTAEDAQKLEGVTFYKDDEIATASIAYYAVWASNEDGDDTPDYRETYYGVTYENTYVTRTHKDPKEYVEGASYTVLANMFTVPEKTMFLGWTTDSQIAGLVKTKEQASKLGTLLQGGETKTMGTNAVTYYAVWAPDKQGDGTPDYEQGYYVHFTTDAAYAHLLKETRVLVDKDSTLAASGITSLVTEDKTDGIALEKWIIDGTDTVLTERAILETPVTADVTYKAVFGVDSDNNGKVDETEKVKVDFTLNDTTNASLVGQTSIDVFPTAEGTPVTFPEVVIVNDLAYKFDGWYENDKLVTSAKVEKGDTTRTFVAKVSQIEYTITFNYEGKTSKVERKHFGDAITAPADVKAEYKDATYKHIFQGWYKTSDTTKTIVDLSKVTVDGNMFFTAKYEDQLLPTLTAKPSTTGWTNKDVVITLTPSAGTDVTKYEVDDGSGWKTITVNRNKQYTVNTKGSYRFRITDQHGETAISNTVDVKIDKVAPTITGPNPVNAQKKPYVEATFTVDGTISNVASVKYIDHESTDNLSTPEKYDAYVAKHKDYEETATVSNGTVKLGFSAEGYYTICVADQAGNRKTYTFQVTNIKESGITTDKSGSTTINGSNGEADPIEIVYGETQWFWLIAHWTPYRTVTINPANGTKSVDKIQWTNSYVADRTFFTSGANSSKIRLETENTFELSGTLYNTGTYTIYIEYTNADGQKGYSLIHIYAHKYTKREL